MKNIGKWQEITQIQKTKVEKEPPQRSQRIRGTMAQELLKNRSKPQRENAIPSQREINSDGTPKLRDILQQRDGTPKKGDTSQQRDGTPKQGDTSQQTDGTLEHENTSNQIDTSRTTRVTRSKQTRGETFRAAIHVYKTYITRQIHAEELVSQELNPNRMAFAASKADEDTMYLHQARKEHGWKNFEEAMAKELQDHQEREHWSVIP